MSARRPDQRGVLEAITVWKWIRRDQAQDRLVRENTLPSGTRLQFELAAYGISDRPPHHSAFFLPGFNMCECALSGDGQSPLSKLRDQILRDCATGFRFHSPAPSKASVWPCNRASHKPP